MKVLVTGGSGFIGQHVCQRLEEYGPEPVTFDRYGPAKRPVYGRNHYLGDVRDYTSVSEAVYHCDGVIDLAGVLGTAETFLDPRPAIAVNISGAMNVFQACQQFNKRCVYISVGNHWMLNPYAITKTTAERFALMMNKESGTEIAIVRGLHAYGPGQKTRPVRKIIPTFIMNALEDTPLTIYGDGLQVADMIYVTDLADILCRALLLDHGVYDRVFEAGTGVRTTVLEVAEQVITAVGRGSIRHAEMRQGEEPSSVVLGDPRTLAALYPAGLPRFVGLEAGIGQTVAYYRALVNEQKRETETAHA
jgi:UDP-glucose 4-epimerase